MQLILHKKKYKTKEIDLKLDSIIADIGKDINSKYRPGKVFIIDSRLAWYTIPDSFSIRLTVDEKTAGERVFQDKKRKKQERGSTIQEAIADTASRRKMEIERYLEQYGVDLTNPNNYKLIIDTTLTNLEDVPDIAKVIKLCEERYQKSEEYCKNWASPKLFYATQSICQTDSSYVWRRRDDSNEDRDLPPFITTRELKTKYPNAEINYKTQSVGPWKRTAYKVCEFAEKLQEEGFYPDRPVTAVSRGNSSFKFLGDDHHRAFASIQAGIKLIPYIITKHTDKLTVSSYQLRDIYDHEGIVQPDGTTFRYAEYPELEEKEPEQEEEK